MIRKSIVAKLWAAIVILMIIVLIILNMGQFQLVENFYYNRITQTLIQQGQQLTELYKNDPQKFENGIEVDNISRIINAHIVLVDSHGKVKTCNDMMMLTQGSFFLAEELKEVFQGDIAVKRGYHHHFATQMLSIAVPIYENNNIENALLLFTPIAPITATLASLRKLIFWGMIGSIILASILAFFLSRSISRPLIQMNKAALEMAKGNFQQNIPVKSKDEIGILSASFNFLASRLKNNITDLSYEKEKLESILASMTDSVITFDMYGKISLFNPQAKKLLDNCPDLELNKLLQDCIHLTQLNSLFQQVLAEQAANKGEIVVNNKKVAVRLSPLFEPNTQKLLGVVALLQDVTKERKLEEMRRDFIANVSHELRTPISLIQGYTEAILDGVSDSPQQRTKFLSIIHKESHTLKRLVEDLLEISRLQSETIVLEKEVFDLEKVIWQVYEKYKKTLDEAKLEFTVQIDPEAAHIWADRFRMEQLLTNLISNAVRYSSKGKISINVGKNDKGVILRISDTGRGIPQEDLPFIFERFYRVDKSRNRVMGGTGLGLSIVKNVVKVHGGEITVASQLGKGTTFTIFLPDKKG